MNHEEKVKAAKAAIDAVFSDTTVSPQETRASLEELGSDIDIMLGSLPAEEGDDD